MHKLMMIAVLLMAASGRAETAYSQTYTGCVDKSEGITVNLLNCIRAETALQDARLNQTYQDLMDKLSPTQRQQLRNQQRAWIAKKNRATFQEANQQGTAALINSQSLYLEMTVKKADELEAKLAKLK